MRKFLIITFSIIVVLVLVGIIGWNALPSWVSSALSKRAKVPVSIGSIRFLSPGVEVKNIRIGNPPNSILPHALQVATLQVNTPLTRFFDDRIVIDLMTMNDVYLGLEFQSQGSTKGNWSTIMSNLKQATKTEKTAAEKKGKTTSVLIKKLIITNLNIDLVYRTGDRRVRKLKPIRRLELNNISSEGGIPTAQIMDIIMSEMLRNVFSKEGLQNMLDGLLPSGGNSEAIQDSIKGLFSKWIEDANGPDILYAPMVKNNREEDNVESTTDARSI
ncbi:MAG: hypothetical protein AAF443_03105 [Chlamydiota bacterium]